MAGSTTNISICMDSELKAQADALFAELGINLFPHSTSLSGSLSGKAGFLLRSIRISLTKKRLLPCWRRKGLQRTRL